MVYSRTSTCSFSARAGGFRLRPDVESDDDGIRCGGEQDVRFRDPSDAIVDDPKFHDLRWKLFDRRCQGLRGALHIGLDDQRQFFDRSFLDLGKQIIERDLTGTRQFGRSMLACPVLRDLSGDALVFDRLKDVTSGWHAGQCRSLRPGRKDRPLALLRRVWLIKRPNFSAEGADDKDIAHMERTALHQDSRHRATTPF